MASVSGPLPQVQEAPKPKPDKSRFKNLTVVPAGHAPSENIIVRSYLEKIAQKDDYLLALEKQFRTQPSPLKYREFYVVGRPPSDKDNQLYRRSLEAVERAHDPWLHPQVKTSLGVQREYGMRGTYFIRDMDPEVASILSDLAEHVGNEEELKRRSAEIQSQNPSIVFPEEFKSGAKFFQELIKLNTKTIAIFKPDDEVRGCVNSPPDELGTQGVALWSKDGVVPESESKNEVIVQGLFPFAQLPVVVHANRGMRGNFFLREKGWSEEVEKSGVLQEFIPNAHTLHSLPPSQADLRSTVPLATFQETAAMDLELMAVDRNHGNILYSSATEKFHYIDNALIAPAGYLSQGVFAWMTWPQALEPFTPETVQKIKSRSFEEKLAAIQDVYPDYPANSLEVLRINHHLMNRAAEAGLSPFQVGWFLSGKNIGGMKTMIQELYDQAKAAGQGNPDATFQIMAHYIDRAVVLLKERFPAVLESVQAKNLPEAEFRAALVEEMDKQAAQFMPI
ncbi:MAG: hypothetical protein JSS32_04310 [Verrucomicrobia bacterium]|nr:hypothetical protein [Verrucomicrobiota bacterium]